MPNYSGEHLAVIKVVGVGGGGTNAVNRMVEAGVKGVEFIAVNTDRQAAVDVGRRQDDPHRRRAHARPGRRRESRGGLSGRRGKPRGDPRGSGRGRHGLRHRRRGRRHGNGRGPIIAEIAREEIGALTVGVVTKPFSFEGRTRRNQADQGIDLLSQKVDTLIVIPNDRLLEIVDKKTSMIDAFRICDDTLRQGIQGITDLITIPGLINLDFADIRTVMKDAGTAMMGIGISTGENRALEAAQQATNSAFSSPPSRARRAFCSRSRAAPTSRLPRSRGRAYGGSLRRRERQHHLRPDHRRGHEGRGSHHGHRHRLQGRASQSSMDFRDVLRSRISSRPPSSPLPSCSLLP